MATGNIEEIKISSELWARLHNSNNHFFNKGVSAFLKRNGLKPTMFNLNCIDKLRGVILTEAQILNLKSYKEVKK